MLCLFWHCWISSLLTFSVRLTCRSLPPEPGLSTLAHQSCHPQLSRWHDLPGMPLLRFHGCLHAFENHRILERHEVVESSLFKRVFTEKCELSTKEIVL